MATLDDSVINLRRFVANLTSSTAALAPMDEHFLEASRRFVDLESRAGDDGDGLSGHLTDANAALDTGRTEAENALTELTQAATQGQQHLAEAGDMLEQAASDLESKVQAALTDLDEADSSLTADGFQAFSQTLDTVEQELETEGQETVQELSALETAIQGFETEAQAAWDEAEHELEEATSALGEGASTLEAEGAEGQQAFEAAATETESHCTDLEGELELIYATLASDVETQGNEWEQAVQDRAQEMATFVQDGLQHRLGEPAAVLEKDALHPLDEEYTTLGTVLDLAGATAGEVEPLAEDLVKTQAVVTQVDALLNAFAG